MNDKPMKEDIKDFYWDYNGRKLAIGVGCAWLGRTDVEEVTIEDDKALLLRCYEAGLRYYDTSRSYSDSELSVGAFVKEIDRKSVFLATKSCIAQSGGFDNFKRNFYDSFKRLETDYIDLFQMHDPQTYDECIDEVLPFLLERKKEGLIRYIGLATKPPVALCLAIEDGFIDSVLSYTDYNLVKTGAKRVIELAQKNNKALINASALMFGLYKGNRIDEAALYARGINKKRAEFAMKLRTLCKELQIDMIHASLQYSLLNPDVDITLNGISRSDNLESTIQAIKNPLYPEQWAAIYELQRSCTFIDLFEEHNFGYKKP